MSCHTVLHATNGYASHLLPFMNTAIIPTRGQVVALRANTSLPFGSGREGFVGNGGWEYWFPRPKYKKEDEELVIFGGGREVAEDGTFESFQTDDSALNEEVGKFIRAFMPNVFPGRFEEGREPEMEWVCMRVRGGLVCESNLCVCV